MKLFCVSLYFKSPAAYHFLSKSFCLPSIRSLHRIFQDVDINPGFSTQLFDVLQTRIKLMADKDKFCILCIDEMSIKSEVSYDNKTDSIFGFGDFGSIGVTKEVGKQALVFIWD